MQPPKLDPPVTDAAPTTNVLTGYDEQHLITYLRLLDADAEGADWREVARIVLHLDPSHDTERAKAIWASHLARAEAATRVAVCECRQSANSSIYFGVIVGNKTDGDAHGSRGLDLAGCV
jgi:hypothetical protein